MHYGVRVNAHFLLSSTDIDPVPGTQPAALPVRASSCWARSRDGKGSEAGGWAANRCLGMMSLSLAHSRTHAHTHTLTHSLTYFPALSPSISQGQRWKASECFKPVRYLIDHRVLFATQYIIIIKAAVTYTMCSFETTVSMSIIRVLPNFVRIKLRENYFKNNSFLDSYKITILPKQLDRFKLY